MAYDSQQNEVFYQRIQAISDALEGSRKEAQELVEIWNAEGISGSPAFTDVGSNTTTEATNMVTALISYRDFWTNVAVPAADRKSNLTPFLANR